MFNFLRKKKTSQLDEFYATVHADAFPGGEQQIKQEASVLKEAMGGSYSSEALQSALLQSTGYLYISSLEGQITGTDMATYLVDKQGLSPEDAVVMTKHLFSKMNASKRAS